MFNNTKLYGILQFSNPLSNNKDVIAFNEILTTQNAANAANAAKLIYIGVDKSPFIDISDNEIEREIDNLNSKKLYLNKRKHECVYIFDLNNDLNNIKCLSLTLPVDRKEFT